MISVQIKNKETKSYPISTTIEDILLNHYDIEDLNFKDRLIPHRLPLFFLTQSSSIILDPSPYFSDDQLSLLVPNPVLTPFDPPSHFIPIVIVKQVKLQVGQTSFFCHPETTIEEVYSYFLPCLGVNYLLCDAITRRPLAYWEKVSSFSKFIFLPPHSPIVFCTNAAGKMTLFQLENPSSVPIQEIAPWHLDEKATVDTLLSSNDVISLFHPNYISPVIPSPPFPSFSTDLKIYDHLQQHLATFTGVPSDMKLSSFAPITSTHFIISNGKLVSFESHLYELSEDFSSPIKVFLFPPKFPVLSFHLSRVTIEDTPHTLIPFLHVKDDTSHLPSFISQRFGLSSNISLSFSDSSHIYVTEQIF